MTLAYLNSEYPSLSHTFIEREVRALRRLGIDIRTYSVRSPNRHGRIGAAHEAAAGETVVLQAGAGVIFKDVLMATVRSPAGLFRALVASQRLSPPGLGFRLRHAAYVAQGVRLARQLAAAGISHVHVHMANNGAAIAMMACAYDTRLRYSLSIHGSAEFFHVDTWTLKEKAEGALFVRCISNFCKAQVMAWTEPASWKRFGVVRCGIDVTEFAPRPARAAGPLRLVTVGRLHPIKGYSILLEACALLRRDGIAFELSMLGDGPMRAHLEALARRLELGPSVRFVGVVAPEQVGEHLDRADAMVVSSFMEGVPVVLMEAMAKELGVVSTRVGGVPELVEDGTTGLLVEPGSCQALADAIKKYAADPSLCRVHGQRGRGRIIEGYGIGGTATGMTRLFERHIRPDAQVESAVQRASSVSPS